MNKKALLLYCLFSLPSLCYSAITRIQFASNTIVGTSLVLQLNQVPVNGNSEIMSIGTSAPGTGAVTSIVQTGATWTSAVQTSNPGVETEIWYAEGVSGASTTITINTGSTFTIDVVVAEYSGLKTSGSFDVSASSFGSLSTGSPFSGTTATTAQSNELWFASLTHQTTVSTGSSDFTSFTNSFSLVGQTTTGILKNGAAERIVSSAGTASTTGNYTGTFFSDTWAGLMATFKASTTQTNAPLFGTEF